MVEKAIPKIPSILAATKEIPLSLVTYPNFYYLAIKPPILTSSCPQYPLTDPDPYVISKSEPSTV